MAGKLYFSGLPTNIDVKKLEERFGVPEPGTLISHQDIETCMGAKWKTSRYKTVLDAWRRKLENPHNLQTWVEPGVGLRILTGNEAVDVRKGDWRKNIRGLRRTVVETKRIDPVQIADPERRKTRDKLEEIASRTFMFAATESKVLRPPKPPDALPRAKQGEVGQGAG